jgi:hypothetical protein
MIERTTRAVAGWFVVIAAMGVAPKSATPAAETGAPVLQYPIGTRSAGMGNAGVADRSDPDNIFVNPASVTAINGAYATTSYRLLNPSFDTDMWVGHASAGMGREFGGGTPFRVGLNLTLAKLSYGTSIATTPTGNPIGEYESTEDYFAVTAGVATTLGERVEWAAGVAFKHAKMTYAPAEFTTEPGRSEATSGMVDVGTVVSTSIDAADWSVHPAVGLAAVNMGSDLEFDDRDEKDPLPSWFHYGVAVRVDGPVVPLGSADVAAVSSTLILDGSHGLNEQHPQWGFGYEVAFMEVASARWGRRFDDHDRDHLDTWGVGLGVPVGPARARFDYASVATSIAESYYYYSETRRDVFGASVAWLFDRGEVGDHE